VLRHEAGVRELIASGGSAAPAFGAAAFPLRTAGLKASPALRSTFISPGEGVDQISLSLFTLPSPSGRGAGVKGFL
jgi:hypothetical protein